MSTKDTGLDDDDSLFDEFLQGKGELAELLRTLPQEQPSAELDAKILDDAHIALQVSKIRKMGRELLEKIENGTLGSIYTNMPGNPVTLVANADLGPAANEVNEAVSAEIIPIRVLPPKAVRGGVLSRWRVPLGIAATLVLSLSVTFMVWEGQPETKLIFITKVKENSAPVIVAMAKPQVEAAAVAESKPAPPPPLALRERDELRARSKAKSDLESDKKVLADSATEMAALSKDTPPAKPAPIAESEPVQLAAASPAAPPPPPAARRMSEPAPKTELAGANSIASVTPDAKTWLAQIEKLIRDDKRTEALAAWQKFRQAYPDYVVEKTIEKQIEAFRTQE
jgi:hypothetical protein